MKPNTFAACRVHRIALRANDKELVDVETLRDAFAVRGRRASVADAIRRAVAAQAAAVRGEPNKPIVEPPLTWREKQEQRRAARARIARLVLNAQHQARDEREQRERTRQRRQRRKRS